MRSWHQLGWGIAPTHRELSSGKLGDLNYVLRLLFCRIIPSYRMYILVLTIQKRKGGRQVIRNSSPIGKTFCHPSVRISLAHQVRLKRLVAFLFKDNQTIQLAISGFVCRRPQGLPMMMPRSHPPSDIRLQEHPCLLLVLLVLSSTTY